MRLCFEMAEKCPCAMHIRMDWTSVGFDWNRARAFFVTAEEGSFSAAARALGTTQPTIGRQVAAFEQELEVILFERVGHRLQLTPTGLDVVEHVRTMGDAAVRLSLTAAGQSLSLDGNVSISASEMTAIHRLPPHHRAPPRGASGHRSSDRRHQQHKRPEPTRSRYCGPQLSPIRAGPGRA